MGERKSSKVLVVDVFLLAFWIVVLFFELLYTQDLIWIIVALVCVFIFSALLGRDVRRRGTQ